MPFDLSSINISLIGWLFIGLAIIVLAGAIIKFFGHLLHVIIRGCGVILLVALFLWILHFFKII